MARAERLRYLGWYPRNRAEATHVSAELCTYVQESTKKNPAVDLRHRAENMGKLLTYLRHASPKRAAVDPKEQSWGHGSDVNLLRACVTQKSGSGPQGTELRPRNSCRISLRLASEFWEEMMRQFRYSVNQTLEGEVERVVSMRILSNKRK